jgi:hypothetical protein
VTLPGTETAVLSLPKLTAVPPVGEVALNVTVQLSVPAPEYVLLAQLSELNTGAVLAFDPFSLIAFVFDDFPLVAVSVAVWVALTEETLAVNVAEVKPEGTVTLDGTVTAALSLDSPIVRPPEGAAAVRETVQLSLAAPVIELSTHAKSLRSGELVVGWAAPSS